MGFSRAVLTIGGWEAIRIARREKPWAFSYPSSCLLRAYSSSNHETCAAVAIPVQRRPSLPLSAFSPRPLVAEHSYGGAAIAMQETRLTQ